MELTKQMMDISFDTGLLEGVLQNAPKQVKDALANVVAGVEMYRKKLSDLDDDYHRLQTNYNNLVALSANYLQTINDLRRQTESLLIETQRDFHNHEE